MFVMKYVGIASSVGLPVEIPFVVRCLADSMAFLMPEDFPIKIDKEFMSWLGSTYYAHLPEHALSWWETKATIKAARQLSGHTMDDSTLGLCLEIFRKQQPAGQPEVRPHIPSQALKQEKCIFCHEIRAMYLEAADCLIMVKCLSAARKQQMRADGDMGRRSMSASFEVGELAVMKETGLAVNNIRAAKISPATITMAPAVDPAENQRSQWRFGTLLTAEEINLRLGSKSRKGRTWEMRTGQWHSGYFWHLEQGYMNPAGYSETNDSVDPPDSNNFLKLAASAETAPPPTDQQLPDRFASRNYRYTPSIAQSASQATVRPGLDTVLDRLEPRPKIMSYMPPNPPPGRLTHVINMFGTPKPSRAATAQPVDQADGAAADIFNMFGSIGTAPANVGLNPAPSVFNMFGSTRTANANTGPALPAVFDMFGTADTTPAQPVPNPALSVFDMFGTASNTPAPPVHNPALSVFDMFGSQDAPAIGRPRAAPATIHRRSSGPSVGDMYEAYGKLRPDPDIDNTFNIFDMFGPSRPAAAMERPTTSALDHLPVFDMFGPVDLPVASAPSPPNVADIFDMFGDLANAAESDMPTAVEAAEQDLEHRSATSSLTELDSDDDPEPESDCGNEEISPVDSDQDVTASDSGADLTSESGVEESASEEEISEVSAEQHQYAVTSANAAENTSYPINLDAASHLTPAHFANLQEDLFDLDDEDDDEEEHDEDGDSDMYL